MLYVKIARDGACLGKLSFSYTLVLAFGFYGHKSILDSLNAILKTVLFHLSQGDSAPLFYFDEGSVFSLCGCWVVTE